VKKFVFAAIALMVAMALVGLTVAVTRSDKGEAEDAIEDATVA
jgi:hypothetical protein